MTSRIYLDNAATSWPKSPAVIEAVAGFITGCGATAGRGTYRSAAEADRWLSEGRLCLSRLIGAGDSRTIAFCSSGTHALNAALWGLIREGDHVVSTQIEHNSVLRPLHHIANARGASVDFAPSDPMGVASLSQAADLIRPATRWIIVGHASNVTGAVQDLSGWAELARQADARLIVDASQTVGYLPIDVQASCISVLAAAGHKGLGGLAGTGFLYSVTDLQPELEPLMTGGTGLNSESISFDSSWPHSIEVGNHNLPGIVSMAVAAKELLRQAEQKPVSWQTHWRTALESLVSGLGDIPGIRLVGYPTQGRAATVFEIDRVPLVSIIVDGWEAHDLAVVLDTDFGIEVRAGYHCAALIHHAIGTDSSGGTLRISLGHCTSAVEIEAILAALGQIVRSN